MPARVRGVVGAAVVDAVLMMSSGSLSWILFQSVQKTVALPEYSV